MLHLFHPACVHFAVAFLVGGSVVEGLGLVFRREREMAIGSWLTVTGTLCLLPTIVTGYLAANSLPLPPGAARTLGTHELVGWLVAAAYTALLFWKGWCGGTAPVRGRALYVAGLAAGLALVVTGAVLGGELVYVHGTGVGAVGSGPSSSP